PVLTSLAALALMLGACGGSSAPSGPRTIRVPADQGTIQQGVRAARPGDIVLIAPGVYPESVHVSAAGITVRGEDRNRVILDGGDRKQNGFWVTADGVAIENLTVRHFTNNGVLFTRMGEDLLEQVETEDGGDNATRDTVDPSKDLLSGYRASYVTAYDNGLYGLYAFASTNGIFEHTYASGHPDSGYYVGQCKPCNAVLRDVTAERNAIGYEGTNASGGVYVIESLFTRNRLGITPNSQDAERLAPQEDTVIAGNRVIDNGDPDTPEIDDGYFGGGILIGGGERNVVVRNLVMDNPDTGIGVYTLGRYQPNGNRVEGNVATGNGVDLAFAPVGTTETAGNCFTGNTFRTSLPKRIEQVLPCGAKATLTVFPKPPRTPAPPGIDYLDVPAPPDQPTMPTSEMSKTGGAGKVPPAINVAAITVPKP
ncbi:MAG: right-handed parallel beta-helix repeat-containing protein, partial [Gaiellales bacterium]